MKFDFKLYRHTIIIFIFALLIPLVQFSPFKSSYYVERFETIFLLFCLLFTLFYTMGVNLPQSQKVFWRWAALWWLALLGRDQNFGYVLLPEWNRTIFHTIAAILILALVLSLLSPNLRKEIKNKICNGFPIWNFLIAVCCYFIVDGVEHGKFITSLPLFRPEYEEIVEELFELPLLFSLFGISVLLQTRDKKAALAKQ